MKRFYNKDELRKYKNLGRRNRQAGFAFERQLAKEFRQLGFSQCRTTREASRLLDSCSVDLWGLPYNVQAKNVRGYVCYEEIFSDIHNLLNKNMPERLVYPTIIFHKQKGNERVIMKKEDFYNLISKILRYENSIKVSE